MKQQLSNLLYYVLLVLSSFVAMATSLYSMMMAIQFGALIVCGKWNELSIHPYKAAAFIFWILCFVWIAYEIKNAHISDD